MIPNRFIKFKQYRKQNVFHWEMTQLIHPYGYKSSINISSYIHRYSSQVFKTNQIFRNRY